MGDLLYAAAFWLTAAVRDAGMAGIAGVVLDRVVEEAIDGMAEDGDAIVAVKSS